MRNSVRIATLLLVGLTGSAEMAASVALSVASPQAGLTVAPGTMIQWRIEALVSSGDNAGLAGFSVNLSQSGANPALFDLPAGTVPAGPMSQFASPAGISNPTPGGFGGTPGGPAGARNLVQIGGLQNTFGAPLNGVGTDVNVQGGIGQGTAQIVAQGSFPAPSTAGVYTFSLSAPRANVLDSVQPAPAFSPVSASTVSLAAASFSFTVGGAPDCPGDLDDDGDVDLGDLGVVLAAFNRTADGDLDGDGDTDLGDLGIVLSAFGNICN